MNALSVTALLVFTYTSWWVEGTSSPFLPSKCNAHNGEECIFEAIGDLLHIGKCLSCAKQCDEDVYIALTELIHGDLDPAAWLKAEAKCLQCIDPCKAVTQVMITAFCLVGKAACHTDFCATCCGKFKSFDEHSGVICSNYSYPLNPNRYLTLYDCEEACNHDSECGACTADNPSCNSTFVMMGACGTMMKSNCSSANPTVALNLGEGKGVCVGNDFNIQCAPAGRECQCGEGSGNPNSCCTGCPNNPSSCGGGHGKNTGNFCGNDFHSKACYGATPICCTNDVGQPACCPIGQICHSPATGDNYCKDPTI